MIYSQSCFSNITSPDTCTERRIFYRLISGARTPRLPLTTILPFASP
jgi:hypothetical protein